MPIIKSAVDASATAPEFGAAVRRGLKALFILRTSLERARLNLAPGKPLPDAEIVGSPAMADGNSCVSGQSLLNYLQTSVPDYFDLTIYALVKSDATMADNANRPNYVGNGVSPPLLQDTETATFGSGLRVTAATAERFGAGFGTSVSDDVSVNDAVAVTHTAWHFMVCKAVSSGADQGIIIRNMTDSPTYTVEATAAARFPAREPFRLLSGYSTEGGICKGAWFQFHNVVCTEDEDEATYAQVKAYQLAAFSRAI